MSGLSSKAWLNRKPGIAWSKSLYHLHPIDICDLFLFRISLHITDSSPDPSCFSPSLNYLFAFPSFSLLCAEESKVPDWCFLKIQTLGITIPTHDFQRLPRTISRSSRSGEICCQVLTYHSPVAAFSDAFSISAIYTHAPLC